MLRLFIFVALIQLGFTAKLGSNSPKGVVPRAETNPIHFNDNGKFKIIHLTDLHYAEAPGSDWGPNNDLKSLKVATDILEWENPDFVVYTGDLISEEYLVAPNGTAYIDMLVQPLVAGNYKWASTYGNHDSGPIITRQQILETEQKYELSYTQQSPEGLPGTTNYFIPIYPPKNLTLDDKPALILWFFDSRGGRSATGGIPSFVDESVVAWFNEEIQQIKDKWGNVPSYAYFHYPTAEYSPIHDDLANHPECTGQHDDIVTPQERDSGLLSALVNSGMVKASFVGHNHANGWCCHHETMVLCYNRQSGHGGGWVGWVRGARVLDSNYNDLWGQEDNYIRLETGEIVDRFPGDA